MPFHPFSSRLSSPATTLTAPLATKQVGERFYPGEKIEVEVLAAAAGQVKLGVRNLGEKPGAVWEEVRSDEPGYLVASKETGLTLVLRRPEGSRIRLNNLVQIAVLQARDGLVHLAIEALP